MKWQAACRHVSNEALLWYQQHDSDSREPDRIVCEWPQLWSGSAKSQTAAQNGSLAKMFFFIGRLQDAFETAGFAEDMTFITAGQWKAQLPKDVVIDRLEEWTGVRYGNHEADAVGIGMYLLGRLP